MQLILLLTFLLDCNCYLAMYFNASLSMLSLSVNFLSLYKIDFGMKHRTVKEILFDGFIL